MTPDMTFFLPDATFIPPVMPGQSPEPVAGLVGIGDSQYLPPGGLMAPPCSELTSCGGEWYCWNCNCMDTNDIEPCIPDGIDASEPPCTLCSHGDVAPNEMYYDDSNPPESCKFYQAIILLQPPDSCAELQLSVIINNPQCCAPYGESVYGSDLSNDGMVVMSAFEVD